ncbi:MAG: hypothetical protein ACXWG6_13485, partial [Usitatibacter sp.]
MRADDPSRIGVLLHRALFETDLGLGLTLRIDARRTEPEPNSLLVHQVREIQLRRLSQEIAGKVSVLWRAHQAFS